MITTPKLDLLFPDTHNLLTIAVLDISEYPTKFAINDPALEITVPGYDKVVAHFGTRNLNLFNSHTLSITCQPEDLIPLPDGIWQFKFSLYPAPTYFVEKKFLRVDNLVNQFQNMFLQMDTDEGISNKCLQSLNRIEFLVKGAVAAANDCNYQLSKKLYDQAQKLIKNGSMY